MTLCEHFCRRSDIFAPTEAQNVLWNIWNHAGEHDHQILFMQSKPNTGNPGIHTNVHLFFKLNYIFWIIYFFIEEKLFHYKRLQTEADFWTPYNNYQISVFLCRMMSFHKKKTFYKCQWNSNWIILMIIFIVKDQWPLKRLIMEGARGRILQLMVMGVLLGWDS